VSTLIPLVDRHKTFANKVSAPLHADAFTVFVPYVRTREKPGERHVASPRSRSRRLLTFGCVIGAQKRHIGNDTVVIVYTEVRLFAGFRLALPLSRCPVVLVRMVTSCLSFCLPNSPFSSLWACGSSDLLAPVSFRLAALSLPGTRG
jgi:hypothetical protein